MTDMIQKGFDRFNRDNPKVYDLFDRFTRQMLARGFKYGSAYLIIERIRWETTVETAGEPVKVNNNYRSRYARLWEERNPIYKGFFRKRALKKHSLNSINLDDGMTYAESLI